MKKAFCGSLCYQGLRGGAIFVDNKFVVYKNQTFTLSERYKNIVIPIEENAKAKKGYAIVFPTVTIYLKNNEKYRFVVFNRKKFIECLQQVR